MWRMFCYLFNKRDKGKQFFGLRNTSSWRRLQTPVVALSQINHKKSPEFLGSSGFFVYLCLQKQMIMAMTVSEMKRDAVNLIYQVDDKNTEKMEKILLFLKATIVPNKSNEKLTKEQNRQLSELESLCGIFEDSGIDNFKEAKEKALIDKYM